MIPLMSYYSLMRKANYSLHFMEVEVLLKVTPLATSEAGIKPRASTPGLQTQTQWSTAFYLPVLAVRYLHPAFNAFY